jgi:hypothetical protein
MTTQQPVKVRRPVPRGPAGDSYPADPDAGLASVAERLMGEFEGRIDLFVITGVVLRCARDLSTVPAGALPELAERSARQRLTASLTLGPRA